MKKIHRFMGPWQIGHGIIRIDDERLVHQLDSVLKMRSGEEVIIGDGKGQEAHCNIISFNKNAALLECTSVEDNSNESDIRVILYCAILKSDNFDLVVQKATEVGVNSIVPIITARTVKLNVRIDRLKIIASEAAEQSSRGIVPTVEDPKKFQQALMAAKANDANLFFDPEGRRLDGIAKKVRSVGIFIGPEGGWDEHEIEQAKAADLRIVSLGSLIMRAETAATIATYLVAQR